MARSKRKPSASKAQTKAKRRKAAPQKRDDAPSVLTTEEKLLKMNEHVNMCVARVNLLTEHTQFLQKKMAELARLTTRELSVFSYQIQELEAHCERTRDDMYRLYPRFEADMTPPQTPLSMDDDSMSEDALIKAVGDFAEALP